MKQQPEKSSGRSPKRSERQNLFETRNVPEGWVEVATAPDQIAAGMLESALKGAGIPVMMNRPGAFAYLGVGGIHGVMVPEGRAEEAREILRDIWDVQEQPPGRHEPYHKDEDH